jgi:hypothetical protein
LLKGIICTEGGDEIAGVRISVVDSRNARKKIAEVKMAENKLR